MKHLNLSTPQYIKLEQGFKEWLEVLGYSSSNVYSNPHHIREFLHYLENRQITDIDQADNECVYGYFEYLKTRKKMSSTGGTIASSFMNKQLQAIKRFTDYLREAHLKSFSTDMKNFAYQRPVAVVLTQTEVQKLYNSVDNTIYGVRDRTMLDLYYSCGLRRNEGILLDTDDILFERGLLYVRAGKNYSERYVPVSSKALENMSVYVKEGRPQLMKEESKETSLFISQRGERPVGQSLFLRLKHIQKNTDDAQLQAKNIGLHTLRHSIATHLLAGGMKLERIAQFLGHKTIESTQIYTHLAHELQTLSAKP